MFAANFLIGLGLILSLAGMAGVIWCISQARKVKRGDVPEDQLQAAFSRLAAVNMGSMGAAGLGLAMALVGFIIS